MRRAQAAIMVSESAKRSRHGPCVRDVCRSFFRYAHFTENALDAVAGLRAKLKKDGAKRPGAFSSGFFLGLGLVRHSTAARQVHGGRAGRGHQERPAVRCVSTESFWG